jgi:AraC-like DNA-binding protein
MLAAQTMEEFTGQKLPPHCKVTQRKNRGSRVPVRGYKQIRQAHGTLARWPKDGLIEGISPSLMFVLNGEADIRIADYRVRLQTGDVLYIPARIPKFDTSRPHYEKIVPEAHCDILMFRADVASTQTVKAHICHSRGDRHTRGPDGECCLIRNHFLFQLLIGMGDVLQGNGDKEGVFHLLFSFILLFQQELERGRGFNSLQFPAESSLSHQQRPIDQAIEYMQNHLHQSLSIELVSHWVGLSRTAFTVQFREETGESFKEHLTKLRLGHAKVLLSQSNLPIERISEQVGLTPGQFRNIFTRNINVHPKNSVFHKKLFKTDYFCSFPAF